MLKALKNLGLTKAEAQVYFYLAKKGPKKASEIASALKISRQRLYIVIRRLQSKAIVNATIDRPATFSAVPLNKVLDLIAKTKIEEAKIIENNKGRLLSDWESIAIPAVEDSTSRFTVIKGRKHVYSKMQQMILDTQSQISVVSNLSGLLRAEHFGVLDVINKHPNRSKIQFRFITEISNQDVKPTKYLIKNLNSTLKVKARNTDIGLSLFPKMVIRDNEELLYFISPKIDQVENNGDYFSLLTNCVSIVNPFSAVFEDLWLNSTEIEQKIAEIETGTLPPRTQFINDAKRAKTKYDKVLENAKKEIFIVTTENRLLDLAKNIKDVDEWYQKGILIKIMSPITFKNYEAAQELSVYCQVRHCPVNYLETIIIDSEHLFQFDITQFKMDSIESGQLPNSTYYTNDRKRVTKTANLLQNVWKNSFTPSEIGIESVLNEPPASQSAKGSSNSGIEFKFLGDVSRVSISDEKPMGKMTERDVINKIINLEQTVSSDSSVKNIISCCSIGFARIHPPSYLNLPDTLIGAFHIDKKSTFGAEDALMIYFWLNTPIGFKYVPMAVVGDNPRGKTAWISQTQGTPAEKNYHLIEKEQIQIQVYGNTLFAEWAKSIPVIPGKYTLPPAAILLEGYGKVRTNSYSVVTPSKVRSNWNINKLEAFVTFIHKESKYTAPGTDGLLIREGYIEIFLP